MNTVTATEKVEEAKAVLGLDVASSPKDAEYNLVSSLLKAADYKTSEDALVAADITRKGEYLFTVHLHPISENEVAEARKHATEYAKNPQGPRYPKIEKGINGSLFNSWMIYLATTEEDKAKIWGNKAVMSKCGLQLPVESIDALLLVGEKTMLIDTISRISGLGDGEALTQEEYAKKS